MVVECCAFFVLFVCCLIIFNCVMYFFNSFFFFHSIMFFVSRSNHVNVVVKIKKVGQ